MAIGTGPCEKITYGFLLFLTSFSIFFSLSDLF